MHIYIIAGPPQGEGHINLTPPESCGEVYLEMRRSGMRQRQGGGVGSCQNVEKSGRKFSRGVKNVLFSSLVTRVWGKSFLECQGITNILHIKPSEIHRNTETCNSPKRGGEEVVFFLM